MTTPTLVTGRLDDLTGLTPLRTTTAHADPQAVFGRLRAEWGEVAPAELEPGINVWLVMGHQELVRVLRQERLFSCNPVHWTANIDGRMKPDSPFAQMMTYQRSAFFTDGEEHQRLREPLVSAVNSLRLRRVRQQVREVCAAAIAGFAGAGRADLLADYAMMVPLMTLGRMLGLSLEASRDMHLTQMEMFALDEKAAAARARFDGIIAALARDRQSGPAGDMAAVLVRHPNLADDDERAQALLLLVVYTSENVMSWVASSLQMMLTDDRFSGRLRGGLLGIDDALDEVLWHETPLSNLPARYALADTTLGGQPIRRGDALVVSFGPANADPRLHTGDQWTELGNRSHLTWGAGPHRCPAEVPARLIVRTAVEEVLHRLPGVRLAVPPEEIGRLPSPISRCPAALPVTFTPLTASR